MKTLFVLVLFLFSTLTVCDSNLDHNMARLPNGVSLHYVSSGSRESPAVILLHGFPEFWYSWKESIVPISSQGYYVIALDQRGYGESDKPSSPHSYNIMHLTTDLILLLDTLRIDKAHLVGHDWGAIVAWWGAYLYQHRFRSVTGLSVPYLAPPMQLQEYVEKFGEDFYINRFQEFGIGEGVFDTENIEWFYRLALTMPATSGKRQEAPTISGWKSGLEWLKNNPSASQFPSWFSEEDLNKYVNNFKKNGFTSPLNYYRNWDRNIRILEKTVKERNYYIDIPSYFIGGVNDVPFLKEKKYVESKYLRNYEGPSWLETGHFIQVEKPVEVAELLTKFFKKVDVGVKKDEL